MTTMSDAPSHGEEVLSMISTFIDTLKSGIMKQLDGIDVYPYKNVETIASMGVGHFFGILNLLRFSEHGNIAKEQVDGILSIISYLKEKNNIK
mgnify:CR=1 FL=1